MSEINFDIEGVLEDARQKTGLSDFGDDNFMEGLGVLLETYDSNGYTERGRKRSRRRVVDLLAARLRIENAFRLHPEIRDEKISQPLFLTGLPRTGTSALLNLLAADPAARPLYMWEGFNPEPIEGLAKGAPDPRYEGMKAFEEDQKKNNPEFAKIHSTSVDTPEECIHLLNHTFCDVQFGVEPLMEPYGSWFQQQDLHKSYAYYADLLRMLQWQRPGERWVLKTPGHLWALDILVELFPDCGIIITHRNPLESVASYCSMMANMMVHREYELTTLGPVVLEYLARKLERGLNLRGQLDEARFLDIQFTDFIDDAVATAEQIYAHFKLPFNDSIARQLRDYDKAHPMNKHGKHEYSLAQYGLSEQQVLDRFAFYLSQYKISMD